MRLTHPLLTRTAGLVSAALVRGLMNTLDMRWTLYDRSVDPAIEGDGRRRIYVFWHEYLLPPMDRRGRCNVTILLSRHRDADLLDRVACHYGFGRIRGSTFDGSSEALRELIRTSRTSHLAFTPDGPRGPRRVMSMGPIYLASKLGMPIVPIAQGYARPWRLNTWDHFAIPAPFSRCRAVLGPEIHIPPRLDREGMERSRLEVEGTLNHLTLEAEAWAEAGTAKVGERVWTRDVLKGNHGAGTDASLPGAARARSRRLAQTTTSTV